MVLTAGFDCDAWAHNVRKVRVVKYIVVYSQIKAADQKFATTKNGQVIHGSLHIDSLIRYLCIPLYILCVTMFTLVILYTLYTPI